MLIHNLIGGMIGKMVNVKTGCACDMHNPFFEITRADDGNRTRLLSLGS